MFKAILAGTLILFPLLISAQNAKIKLWKNAENKHYRHLYSTITLYQPTDSLRNGASVIVCPGGSYHHLGLNHEGRQVAEWFRDQGFMAAVLRYRVSGHVFHHPAMIEDIQRSIQWMRMNATLYQLDTNRVGVIGFSAGGHLVVMAGEFAHHDYLRDAGISNTVSLRPDFVMAIYPVVSMEDSIAHEWSRESLLTKHYTKTQQDQFSMDQNVPSDMPPVFLLACKDDPVVDYRNSRALYTALKAKQIPCKYVLFNQGGHGFGMFRTKSAETTNWNLLLLQWLQQNHFTDKY